MSRHDNKGIQLCAFFSAEVSEGIEDDPMIFLSGKYRQPVDDRACDEIGIILIVENSIAIGHDHPAVQQCNCWTIFFS